MRLYKIRAWVLSRPTRGKCKGELYQVYKYENVIVDNVQSAMFVFAEQVREVKTHSGVTHKVELFEPHIYENGELAYWPDNEKYIMEYDGEKE